MNLGPVLLPVLLRNETVPKGKELSMEQCRMTSRLIRNFSKIQEKLAILLSASSPGNEMHTAIVELLRIMVGMPLMRCIENPVSECLMNLVIPVKCMAYGGQIGQWTEQATALDRFGPLLGSGGQKSKVRAVLKVHVHKIKLHNHPLFSDEQVAYAALLREYANYTYLLNKQSVEHWNLKLLKLMESLKKLILKFDNDERAFDSGDFTLQIRNLYYGLLHILSQLYETKRIVYEQSNKLYAAWQTVKSIRRDKGYSNTVGVLHCRKITGEDDDDKRERKRKVVVEDSEAFNVEGTISQAYILAAPKLVKDAQIILQKISSGERSEHEDLNSFSKHRQWVNNAVDKLNSQDLSLKYIFRLVGSGQITPDREINDSIERTRRSALQKTDFRIVIRVKNKIITRSRFANVNAGTIDGVVVDIMQVFEFRIFNQPQKLTVDIVYRNHSLLDQREYFAGSCSIDVPGRKLNAMDDHQRRLLTNDSSSGFTPLARWYDFFEKDSMNNKRNGTLFSFTKKTSEKARSEVAVFTDYSIINHVERGNFFV